jgi:hypothetical protein
MIHIGTKTTESKRGWVADFCPICRLPRAFQLYRLGEATTISGVALTEGTLLEMQIECSACRVRLPTDEAQYAGSEKKRPEDFSYLVLKTFPTMPEALAERLALEERIRRDPKRLEPEVRQRLLAEPFFLLNATLERQTKETHFDKPATIGCLATLLVFTATMFLWVLLPREIQAIAGIAALTLIGLGTIYTVVQLAFVPARYVRRQILPHLAHALTPLAPDREELKEILEDCRQRQMPIGKRVTIEALWTELTPPLRKP